MYPRKNKVNTNEIRLMSIDEAAIYVGLGRTATRVWVEEIGAIKRFGKRLLVDKKIVDAAIDAMGEV